MDHPLKGQLHEHHFGVGLTLGYVLLSFLALVFFFALLLLSLPLFFGSELLFEEVLEGIEQTLVTVGHREVSNCSFVLFGCEVLS